jgi:hypothetical protein
MRRIEACVKDIKAWAVANKLKFNDVKTEVLHVTSRFRTTAGLQPVKIGDTTVNPCTKARNLGVIFDNHVTMESHISNILRTGWGCIYKLGKIRRFLDTASTEKLIHAFVTSRIDSCNSLLTGLPEKQIIRLQRLQNAAARLVSRSKRRVHITPVLYQLHWLPVCQRINYKILLLIFKCLHNLCPSYLQELIKRYEPTRSLRSASHHLLDHQHAIPRTVTHGQRAFAIAAPTLWNSIPDNIRSITESDNLRLLSRPTSLGNTMTVNLLVGIMCFSY